MEHDDGHATTYTLHSDQLATVFALVNTTSTARSHANSMEHGEQHVTTT